MGPLFRAESEQRYVVLDDCNMFVFFVFFYMNDIVERLYYVKLSMCADDCVLYLSGNN